MSITIDCASGAPTTADTETSGAGAAGARVCAAWAAAGIAAEYVVYEGPRGYVFAGGVTARIRVTGASVTVTDGAGTPDETIDTRAYSGTPAAALAAALASLRDRHWRVYGWTAFEFTSHLRPEHRAGLLAELIVPRFEIAVAADGTVDPATVPADLRERLAAVPIPGPSVASPVDVRADGAAYRDRVAAAIAEIRTGAYDKVILSRRLPVPFEVDMPASYALGRAGNTPARSFLLRLSGFRAAGFSPEIVGAVHEGTVLTQPLAGTRALNIDGADPVALREELLHDAKEIVEHAISVQLSCAEIDLVAVPGSRVVSEFMSVRERGSVQHLASTVRGRLAPGRTPWEALDALFPAVTASGIPKAPAVDAIARHEPQARGLYAGAVVTASSDGDLDAALVLRSLYSTGDTTWLQAGAGIIAQSDPAREFEETCEKLTSVAPYLVRRAGR